MITVQVAFELEPHLLGVLSTRIHPAHSLSAPSISDLLPGEEQLFGLL